MTAQDLYKLVFEKGPDANLLLSPKGLVTEANCLAQRLYGFKREELLHRPLPTIPEDLKEEFFRLLEKVREGEEVVDWETRRLNKGKKVLEVSVSLSCGRRLRWVLCGERPGRLWQDFLAGEDVGGGKAGGPRQTLRQSGTSA